MAPSIHPPTPYRYTPHHYHLDQQRWYLNPSWLFILNLYFHLFLNLYFHLFVPNLFELNRTNAFPFSAPMTLSYPRIHACAWKQFSSIPNPTLISAWFNIIGTWIPLNYFGSPPNPLFDHFSTLSLSLGRPALHPCNRFVHLRLESWRGRHAKSWQIIVNLSSFSLLSLQSLDEWIHPKPVLTHLPIFLILPSTRN
jgi:hypothetical protein